MHDFTTDANLQKLQKEIHLRGGIGVKTFDVKAKVSKVDRHSYKYYATEIVEFIQRPTLLGALTTVEDTEGAMSFYDTSKAFAESEKELSGPPASRKRRASASSSSGKRSAARQRDYFRWYLWNPRSGASGGSAAA